MEYINKFIKLNKKVADKFQNAYGERYFGNLSTRCAYMFPTTRLSNDIILVSARNTNKKNVSIKDMIFTHTREDGTLFFGGRRRPSVDTPIQTQIYKWFPHINYMIHGHAYTENAETTKYYYPCGDMREAAEIFSAATKGAPLAQTPKSFVINLKNHGFLVGASTLGTLETLIDETNFIVKGVKPTCRTGIL